MSRVKAVYHAKYVTSPVTHATHANRVTYAMVVVKPARAVYHAKYAMSRATVVIIANYAIQHAIRLLHKLSCGKGYIRGFGRFTRWNL